MSMNLSYWLNLRENLLLQANNRTEMPQFLELVAQFHYQIGMVSDSFPLLASLSVLENITLMNMYHQKKSATEAYKALEKDITALGMQNKLHLHREKMAREDILKTYVLRCVAKNNIIILLNTPRLTDVSLVQKCLDDIEKKIRLWVLCLEDDSIAYRNLNLRTIPLVASTHAFGYDQT